MKTKISIVIYALYISSVYKVIPEYYTDFKGYLSGIGFLCDVVIMAVGFSLIKGTKRSIFLGFLFFLLFSTLNFVLNQSGSLVSHINGLREFLDLFALFIFFNRLAKTEYLEYFNEKFKKFAIVFLILQIPASIMQFIASGYKAGDTVGGTLGNGGSGILTFLIFIMVYYLIENTDKKTFQSKMRYLFSISVFFIPIIINETKISFILIPILFLTLVDIKDIKASVLASVLGVLVFLIFISTYSDQGETYKNPFTEIFSEDFLQTYLAGDVQSYEDVPRMTKIIMSFQLLSDETAFILGQEYGAFKGGTTLDISSFATKYQWLLQGTKPYFFYLLVTGGISLIILFVWLFMAQINDPYRSRFSQKSKFNRLLLFLIALFFLIMFYNDSFRELPFLIIFIYIFFFTLYSNNINNLNEV